MLQNKMSRFLIMVIVLSLIAMVLPALGEEKKQLSSEKIATVNGVPIDRAEFDGGVLTLQKTLLGLGKPLTCKQMASIQAEVLESLIRREIIYQEGRKVGINPDEKAVNQEIKTLMRQFSNETEYKNELSRKNISEAMLRSRIERNNIIQQYVQRLSAKIEVTDQELIAYYQGHLDLFKQPLQTCVSHILIQKDLKWEEARTQEARLKAEQIMKKLKNGQDFAAIAREYSDGPTRANGGDLGCLRMGQLDKQFESAVFTLKPGEMTDIIETDYGFHLFKVTDKKPETVLTFESVKERLQQFLREEKAKQEAESRAKALRDKTNVEILLGDDISLAKRP